MGLTMAISWLLLSFQVVPAERLDPAAAIRLATQLRNERKLAEAETTLLKVLATVTASGREGQQAAMLLNELALVYHELDSYAKAEDCFKRSLRLWERVCGPEGRCLVAPFGNLVSHYLSYGQVTKADRIGRRLERIRLDGTGPDDPDLLLRLRVLASIHYARSRYSQAEPLLQQVLRLLEQTGADADPPGLASTWHGLAAICTQQGRYSEAVPYFERALGVWKQTSDNVNLASGLKNLAVVYGRTGRLAEAEALFLPALPLAESSYEPTHPFMEEVLSGYAWLLREAGREAEAKKLEKRASAIREKYVPRDDQYMIDIHALGGGKRK